MTDQPPSPKRRLRFSLLNLLLLMTIVAMAFGLHNARQQRVAAEQQARRLRAEFGYVNVTDPRKLCFRVSGEPLEMHRHLRCRAYVPTRHQGVVELTFNHEQPGRKKKGSCTMRLPAGETTFDLHIYRDAVGDAWRYALTSPSPGIAGAECQGPLPPWFADDGRSLGFQYGMMGGELAAGESAELLSRACKRGDGSVIQVRLEVKCEQPPAN